MNEIKIFCPATIANLNCGFDVMGLCLEGIGDEMIIRKTSEKGIKITKITGANLPLETEKMWQELLLWLLSKTWKLILVSKLKSIKKSKLVVASEVLLQVRLERFWNQRIAWQTFFKTRVSRFCHERRSNCKWL